MTTPQYIISFAMLLSGQGYKVVGFADGDSLLAAIRTKPHYA